MTSHITESVVEDTALEWFEAAGYSVVYGPTIAPGEDAERSGHAQVTLDGRRRATAAKMAYFRRALRGRSGVAFSAVVA